MLMFTIYHLGVHTSIINYNQKQHNDKHKSWVTKYGYPWQKRSYNWGGAHWGASEASVYFLNSRVGTWGFVLLFSIPGMYLKCSSV